MYKYSAFTSNKIMIAIFREDVTFAALEQELGNIDSFWEGGKPGIHKEDP